MTNAPKIPFDTQAPYVNMYFRYSGKLESVNLQEIPKMNANTKLTGIMDSFDFKVDLLATSSIDPFPKTEAKTGTNKLNQ